MTSPQNMQYILPSSVKSTTLSSGFQQDYISLLFENDFLYIIPEFFLILATLFLLMYGVVYTTSKKENYPILHTNITWLALFSLLLTLFLMVNSPILNGSIFYNTLVYDELSFFFKVVILFGAFFSIYIALEYIIQESLNAFEYSILILLATISMFFLASSADFISLYLAVELQSLCFYVLAASKRNSEFSTEAGLKYFLLGAFSSGLLLFGCSMIYGFTGITNFTELAKIFTCGSDWQSLGDIAVGSSTTTVLSDTLALDGLSYAISSTKACELGMIFLLVGFLFKLTVAPFHMWSPDVYEGAPTSVTAFFAITPKAAILAIFIRIFLESFYDFMLPWQKMIIFSSLASMIIGAFAALSQNKLKRLLAFSSIGHIGYILVGFCCGTIQGIQAMLLYLVVYMVMNIALFAILLSPVRRDSIHSVQRVKYITDLSMLSKTNPLLAFSFITIMFSIAGIPPLAGFYSKAFLFFAAMSSTMYLLALIGVLTSVVSCFYYIRLIKIIYFETPTSWCSFSRMTTENSIILGICFFFILLFMVNPTPLYLITHKVALSLSF